MMELLTNTQIINIIIESLCAIICGINVAGGNDSSSFNRPGANNFNVNTDNILTINGGNINIDASGDGIDVNGNAYIYSGNIIVYSPTSGADSALDYDGEFVMDGGTLIAGGSSEMTTSISNNSKQYNVLIYFDSTITGEVKILNNDEMISYNSNKKYSSLIISSPELVKNTTYTIEVNNDKYKTFTISSITTNVGNKIMSNNQFRR